MDIAQLICTYPRTFTVAWFFFWNAAFLLFFLALELLPGCSCLFKRLPSWRNGEPRNKDEILQVLRESVVVEGLVIVPAFVIIFRLAKHISVDEPTLFEFVYEFLTWILIEEIVFYFVHRAMHHPYLYPKFHYKHHTPMRLPYCLSALVNDPVDAVIFLGVTWVGVFFIETHFVTLWVRIPWIAWLGYYSHSKLILEYDPCKALAALLYFDYPGFHLTHHHFPTTNYGMHTPFMDKVFKTSESPAHPFT